MISNPIQNMKSFEQLNSSIQFDITLNHCIKKKQLYYHFLMY